MITTEAYRDLTASNRVACQSRGDVWFAMPNDPTGTGQGSCVPPDIAARKDFDPARLFSSFQWNIGGSAPGVSAPAPPNPAQQQLSLGPQVINGAMPDITAAAPPAPPLPPASPCAGAAEWIDSNKGAAVLLLLGAFVLLGGTR